MPYKKDTTHPLTKLMYKYGYTSGNKLKTVLHCSTPTAVTRLQNPDTLTVAELTLLNTDGHIPIKEIRAAIGGKG